jgi:hypothetical protein
MRSSIQNLSLVKRHNIDSIIGPWNKHSGPFKSHINYEVLTAMAMNGSVTCDITRCKLLNVNGFSENTQHVASIFRIEVFLLTNWLISQARNTLCFSILHAGFSGYFNSVKICSLLKKCKRYLCRLEVIRFSWNKCIIPYNVLYFLSDTDQLHN